MSEAIAAAAFEYVALERGGVTRTGRIEAVDRAAAIDALHGLGLIPVRIERADAASPTPILPRLWARAGRGLTLTRTPGSLSFKEVAALTHSLAALLRARVSVDRALSIAAGLEQKPDPRRVLESLGRSVRSGLSFSDAMRASAVRLPDYYVSMAQAGELGGTLPETLGRLSQLLQRQLEVRERIRSALIYPCIMAFVVAVTLVTLITFVLPRFRVLFDESEASVPWSTRAVLSAGAYAHDHAWILLGTCVAAVLGVRAYFLSDAGTRRFQRWLLLSRYTLGLPAMIDTARMFRTLGTLIHNGQPLPTALRVARGTVRNALLRAALERATQRVNAGQAFTVALAESGLFPTHAIQLARVGEEGGCLDEMLIEAATIMEADSERLLDRLLSLIVPGVTIGMGIIVAALIGSVMIGLLSINDLAL